MSALAEVQRAFTRVCFDETPREEDLSLLYANRERWLMYRRMVRSRLFAMMRSGLPRTAKLLGKERFDAAVARYLAERAPKTRFIREVVHELVEHALPSWEADESLPPHLGDLVRFEDAKWRALSIDAAPQPSREFDFEAVPSMNPTIIAVPLRHRVDKDAVDPIALDEPHLALVYRKPESARTRCYVLNDIGARLYRAWSSGELTCAGGARRVLDELGRQPDGRFVDGMAGVLADLIEQKIILGSRR